MKNYDSKRRKLRIFIVLVLATLAVGILALPKPNLPVAIAATLFIAGLAAVAVTGSSQELSTLNNEMHNHGHV